MRTNLVEDDELLRDVPAKGVHLARADRASVHVSQVVGGDAEEG